MVNKQTVDERTIALFCSNDIESFSVNAIAKRCPRLG
ncbi:hypothetical protein NUACC26_018960 [Scytonema sp. NUACC26]